MSNLNTPSYNHLTDKEHRIRAIQELYQYVNGIDTSGGGGGGGITTETDPVFSASAAASISSTDITNWNSKTSNAGTITGITMNGASKGTSGVVDLGTVLTEHQSLKTINGNSVSGSGNLDTNPPIVNHGTSDTTFTVTPNKLHIWGEVTSLTLTLATPTDATIVNEYMLQFTSGSTATTLSLPNTITWTSTPNIQANKTYQISIINGLGVIAEFGEGGA